MLVSSQILHGQNIELVSEIHGRISPKSIVYNGNGIFSAQNMMYRHTVTLYNSQGELLKTIDDKTSLKSYGFEEYKDDSYYGAPVEACFSEKGKFLWVSNYSMLGSEFKKEGCDGCSGTGFDPSFVYKINTSTYEIENVIKVGSVPKYLALNEKTNVMLVTNWSSSDVSIVDLITEKEIKKVKIGKHPRGVDITTDGKTAYITVMGGYDIVKLNLQTFETSIIESVGKAPRHIVLSENDDFLYCTINSANQILKLNLATDERVFCKVKSAPRTMVLSANQKFIYVVNYFTDSFQKIDAETMIVLETKETGHHPIGISANWETSEVWVACYSGVIQIFKDVELETQVAEQKMLAVKPGDRLKQIPQYSFANIVNYNTDKQDKQRKEKKELLALKNEKHKAELAEEERLISIQTNKEKADRTKEKLAQLEIKKEKISKENTVLNSNCKYHLIIGSFGLPSNATGLVSKMKTKGYPAQIIPSKNGKMSMVSIQCFSSVQEVGRAKSKILKDSKQKGWVYVQ
jgi:YVTN family beta-propeller protein